MNTEIIERFISNQCSKEELEEIANWLKKKDSSLKDRIWWKKYWNSIDTNRDYESQTHITTSTTKGVCHE